MILVLERLEKESKFFFIKYKLVFQLCMVNPTGEKILYLLPKIKSKGNKVRHFRVSEMKEFMFGRMHFICICYI